MKVAVGLQQVVAEQTDHGLRLADVAKRRLLGRQLVDSRFEPGAEDARRLRLVVALRFDSAEQRVDIAKELRITRAAGKVQVADDFLEECPLGRVGLKK